MLLLVACGDTEPEGNPLERARQLHAEDQYELALIALREAMRADPDDPEARLLLAEVYLDLEEGDLARTAIEQAVERGLARQRASLPLGRALFLERRDRCL